tara:strand:+ start:9956 stop:12211 length:2256 start_codon:yes stop_codon:yes gene_type:complete
MHDHAEQPEPREAVERRLADLERRVAALEAGEGIVSDRAPQTPTPPAARPTPTPPAAAPASSATPARETADRPAMSRPMGERVRGSHLGSQRSAKSAKPSRSVEQLIGGKWFLVLGVLIVVAGVGFFLKLAYDQGWIGNIPPVWRCLISAAFGFGLIGVGRLTAKRLGRFAATGFSAAGLGVLYATAFATFAVFSLVGATAAFAMLAAVSAIGLGIALPSKSLTLAILSIVAAYLTPFVLVETDSPAWSLAPYLLAVLGVGSVLAVREHRYRALASITWWGTGLLGGYWVADRGPEIPAIAMGFIGLVWLVVHATRMRLPAGGGMPRTAMPGVTSFSTTLWALGGGLLIMDGWGVLPDWTVPAALTVATLAGGQLMAGMLRVLTDPPRTEREVIGVSLMAQAGALLPMAIMLAVDTAWSQVMIWAVLGLAGAFAGRWARAAALGWYGGAILLLGIGRVGIEATGPLHAGQVGPIGLVFSWWMALVGLMAAACLGAAWLAKTTRAERSGGLPVLAVLETVAGCLLLAAMVLHEDATPKGLLLAYLIMTVLGMTVVLTLRRRWVIGAAAGYASLGTVAWAAAFIVEEGWFSAGADAPAFLHPGLLWSLPLLGVWFWLARTLSAVMSGEVRELRVPAWVIYGALLLTATTLEVTRVAGMVTVDTTAQAGSVSLWWAALATVTLVLGVVRRMPPLRYAGIGLLLVATGKVLTFDLAQVSPAIRVLCFIGLGLVLLAVAAGYLRTARAVSASGSDE